MKINGLKKTVSELKKCPKGWGLLVGYNAKTNKLFTSELCHQGNDWINLEFYEFSIGYFSGDYPVKMQDLADRVCQELDYCSNKFGLSDNRRDWANKALAKLS